MLFRLVANHVTSCCKAFGILHLATAVDHGSSVIEDTEGWLLMDTREEHASAAPKLWFIASRHEGIGYQTLIKQILARSIEAEKKQLWREEVPKVVKAERDGEARTNHKAA